MTKRIKYHDILKKLPAPIPDGVWDDYLGEQSDNPVKIVVLDDDPTGTQTVYDTQVLTNWSVDLLVEEFKRDSRLFYILTNSRAFPEEIAVEMNDDIAHNLVTAGEKTGIEFMIISRSDSTLRGHYPAEIKALKESLGLGNAVEVIIPAFFEGGRYTIDGIHYVKEGEWLVPVNQTAFSRDPVFSYRNADLKNWVLEKNKSRIDKEAIHEITIRDIRGLAMDDLKRRISGIPAGDVIIINAQEYTDLIRVAQVVSRARKEGMEFIFRSAASWVAALGGLKPKPLLSANDFPGITGNGLIIIGSYISKTNTQYEAMRKANPRFYYRELDLRKLRDGEFGLIDEEEIVEGLEKVIRGNNTAVLYTSRKQEEFAHSSDTLDFGTKISQAMVSITRKVKVKPGFILVKGGITSSDIAVKALGIRKALVKGQIIAGVPVWIPGKESKWPGVPYVVFPGNVGDDNAINQVIDKMK